MGYNVWLASFRDIDRYYERKNYTRSSLAQLDLFAPPDISPLFFYIDGVGKQEFTLDEIDYFVCSFKDEAELRKSLSKYKAYEKILSNPGFLTIASNSKNIGKYKVVYNNPFLKKCASVIRNKRRLNQPEFLDRTKEIEEFVKTIAQYAVNKSTSESIINYGIFPPHVKITLRAYKESVLNNNLQQKARCFENLYKYCLNYKTLRSFVLWQKEYQDQINRKRRETRIRNKEQETELKNALEHLALLDEEKKAPYRSEVLEAIDGMRDEDGNIDFDLVYSIFDTEDIYTIPSKDLKSIGINNKDNSSDKGQKRKWKKN